MISWFWKRKNKEVKRMIVEQVPVSSDGRKIQFEGTIVECPIENHLFHKAIRFDRKVVACCLPPVNSGIQIDHQNILAYDEKGNLLWRNEPLKSENNRDVFTDVDLWDYDEWSYFYKEHPEILKTMERIPRLYGLAFSGIRFEIDPNTGAIIEGFFTRGY